MTILLALALVLAVFVVVDYMVRKFAKWFFSRGGRPKL